MLNTCHPAPILTVSETGPGSSALICPPTSDTPRPASNHNGPANTTRRGDTLPHVVLVVRIKTYFILAPINVDQNIHSLIVCERKVC